MHQVLGGLSSIFYSYKPVLHASARVDFAEVVDALSWAVSSFCCAIEPLTVEVHVAIEV